MSTAAAAPQTNGIPPSSAASSSQTLTNNNTQQTNATTTSQQSPTTITNSQSQPNSQPSQQPQQPAAAAAAAAPPPQSQPPQQPPHHPLGPAPGGNSITAPRPREARTIELLLTAQGVTAFEQRVPLLLLDFAYRHTSAVLQDALQLSADPYTFAAGAKASSTTGQVPVNVGDATVTASAVQLAISSRLGFQFRSSGGAASKDWLMDLAKERNKVALSRIPASEWGVRLPGERFVLSGTSWGLRDVWAGQEAMEDTSDDDDVDGNAKRRDQMPDGMMEGVETAEDIGGDGVEGGTIDDVFGDEAMDEDDEDEEMIEV
ncbi:transcription initiation factor IID, 31kD subunit-domain-containing protein [Podospora australis]|uniref:Transcription initiation factor IID, 31kD subunit-domain-containing protein n=1 Tax=Podospora australis TaxID=1536484 RepID=A0AAN6WUM0_9PEZI|nr:transcription initiation factor IID, 31kD subunit-domain-containing protein [Podospora australis]